MEGRLQAVAKLKYIQARELGSVTGTLMSMNLAIGRVSCLMTWMMYGLIESVVSWCDKLMITDQARSEIECLLLRLESLNSQPVWREPSVVRIAYSDASNTG